MSFIIHFHNEQFRKMDMRMWACVCVCVKKTYVAPCNISKWMKFRVSAYHRTAAATSHASNCYEGRKQLVSYWKRQELHRTCCLNHPCMLHHHSLSLHRRCCIFFSLFYPLHKDKLYTLNATPHFHHFWMEVKVYMRKEAHHDDCLKCSS